MIFHLLNESPEHLLDAIKILVDNNEINADTALLLLDASIMIKKMRSMDYPSIDKISIQKVDETIKACKSYQQTVNQEERNKFIKDFISDNKTKIYNDIELQRKWLMTLYKDAEVI